MLYSTVPGPSSGRLGPFVGNVFQEIRPAEGKSEPSADWSQAAPRRHGGSVHRRVYRASSLCTGRTFYIIPAPFAKHTRPVCKHQKTRA